MNGVQRAAKAKFWATVADSPLVTEPADLTSTEIARLCGTVQYKMWAVNTDGFKDWFLNKNTTQQALAAGAEPAVKRLTIIVEAPTSREIPAAAQVNAAKVLLEYAGFAPAKVKEITYKDKQIAKMDENQLEAFIEKTNNSLGVVK